jgi:rfaE bifunctional protein nucleotidyltransferase chain/domain
MKHRKAISHKIVSVEDAKLRVAQWKERNETIVFTNGCFDLLHKGHVDYLNKAADLGTKLILGLNSDASVSRLKGAHRPIQDEDSRSHIMASLSCVDLVVIFNEDTPKELIDQLLPEVLVKGGDYALDDIVGAEAVLKNGGKVQTLEFLPGHSTSIIEAKIKKA